MKDLLIKNDKKIQFIYELTYILLVISTFNSFLFTSSVQSVLVKICLGAAACAGLSKLLLIKNYLKTPYWQCLVLFMLSYFISSLMNYKYGLTVNMKWLIWLGLSFFLLYLKDIECDNSYYKREFIVLGHILLIYSACSSLVSLGLMVTRYAKNLSGANNTTAMAGYFWGRLWGVYTDPNYGAAFCVSMIILALYFIYRTQKNSLRILYVFMIVLDFLYIVYSDSRTAKVAISVGGGFFVFSCVWYLCKKYYVAKRIGISIIGVVLFIVSINGIMSGCKDIYIDRIGPYIENHFSGELETEENIGIQKKKESDKIRKEVTSVQAAKEREEDVKKDISNRRFDLWKSGIEVWMTTPLFGTGYETYDKYAIENVPDTYTVNNDQGIFGNTHNQYINILVFQGIIGFIIFLVFIILMIYKILPFIWKCKGEDFFYIVSMVSIIVVVAVSMMFLLEGLYTNSFGTFLLWYLLGNTIHFITRSRTGADYKEIA